MGPNESSMSQSQQLRVGIFGVGRMGRVHLENLIRLSRAGEIELIAMGDRYPPTLIAAERAAVELGGTRLAERLTKCSTPEQMVAARHLDAVVIASRTEDHASDSLTFTRHGIPVLVEKPLANSVAEAVKFCQQLGAAGDQLVQVAFHRFYDAATQVAMDWAARGLVGEVQQSHHVLQDKNPTPPAYQSCGITADMAIHLIFEALCFHGFELPRHVQALRFMAPHYEDRAGEGANIVHVFCSWPDGSVAHLWGSRINNTGYDNGFKVIGTGGRIDVGEFVGDFGVIRAKLWRGTGRDSITRGTLAGNRRFPMSRPSAGHPDFYARYARAYASELKSFLQHVRTRTPFEIDPQVGWKTLLVANTAEVSSRRGGHRFELALKDGTPISTINNAAEFATTAGLT
jgi:myo-inositol 2-dehydrogenase/D-chiro-inositol 1-dehydrogenase